MNNWMSTLRREIPEIDQLTLRQLVIPGTHDSGTYSLMGLANPDTIAAELYKLMDAKLQALLKPILPGDIYRQLLSMAIFSVDPLVQRGLGIINDIIKPISQTQTLSIEEQLQQGARYIDLRVAVVNEHPIIVHGICRTNVTLADALWQIRAFAAMHDEIILIDVKTETDVEAERKLIMDSLIQDLDVTDPRRHDQDTSLLARSKGENAVNKRKLGDFWQNGRIAVGVSDSLQADDCDYSDIFFPRVMDSKSTWVNTTDPAELKRGFVSYVFDPPEAPWLVQCQLSPPGVPKVLEMVALETLRQTLDDAINLLPVIAQSLLHTLGFHNPFPTQDFRQMFPLHLSTLVNPCLPEWISSWPYSVNVVFADAFETSGLAEVAVQINKTILETEFINDLQITGVRCYTNGECNIRFNRIPGRSSDHYACLTVNDEQSAQIALQASTALQKQQSVTCYGQLNLSNNRLNILELGVSDTTNEGSQ